MKLSSKVGVVLLVAYLFCSSVVSVGHEVAGITLDKWWQGADVFQFLLLGYLVAYPVAFIAGRIARRNRVRRSYDRLARRSGL